MMPGLWPPSVGTAAPVSASQICWRPEAGWMLHDLMRFDPERGALTTEERADGDGFAAVRAMMRSAPDAVRTAAGAELPPEEGRAAAPGDPKRLVPGVAFAGRYQVTAPVADAAFVSLPFVAGTEQVFLSSGTNFVAMVDAVLERLLPQGSVLIPALLGRDFELERLERFRLDPPPGFEKPPLFFAATLRRP